MNGSKRSCLQTKGKFICSAAPTELEDGLAKDVDVHISGGFFEPEGLKISGQLILPLPRPRALR